GEAGDVVLGGVDERDRSPVAVPDEDRAIEPQAPRQLGHDLLRLLVHEARRSRAGRGGRPAVPVTGEGDGTVLRGGRKRVRKVLPQARRPQSAVHEHHCRLGTWNLEHFELAAWEVDRRPHAAWTSRPASSSSKCARAAACHWAWRAVKSSWA